MSALDVYQIIIHDPPNLQFLEEIVEIVFILFSPALVKLRTVSNSDSYATSLCSPSAGNLVSLSGMGRADYRQSLTYNGST